MYNRRLQRWLKQKVDEQCSNMVALPNDAGLVAVPTHSFNIVYQLYHLYHHYFYEGVGLRQVVDYYFVVTGLKAECEMLGSLQRELKRLGLWKFAGAMMFVLHKVMGMTEDNMIAPMDAKRGGMLLDDILNGGNFGHYDERHAWGRDSYDGEGFKHGALGHNLLRLYRDARLLRYYPAEVLSEPIFRVWHFLWRVKNEK